MKSFLPPMPPFPILFGNSIDFIEYADGLSPDFKTVMGEFAATTSGTIYTDPVSNVKATIRAASDSSVPSLSTLNGYNSLAFTGPVSGGTTGQRLQYETNADFASLFPLTEFSAVIYSQISRRPSTGNNTIIDFKKWGTNDQGFAIYTTSGLAYVVSVGVSGPQALTPATANGLHVDGEAVVLTLQWKKDEYIRLYRNNTLILDEDGGSITNEMTTFTTANKCYNMRAVSGFDWCLQNAVYFGFYKKILTPTEIANLVSGAKV